MKNSDELGQLKKEIHERIHPSRGDRKSPSPHKERAVTKGKGTRVVDHGSGLEDNTEEPTETSADIDVTPSVDSHPSTKNSKVNKAAVTKDCPVVDHHRGPDTEEPPETPAIANTNEIVSTQSLDARPTTTKQNKVASKEDQPQCAKESILRSTGTTQQKPSKRSTSPGKTTTPAIKTSKTTASKNSAVVVQDPSTSASKRGGPSRTRPPFDLEEAGPDWHASAVQVAQPPPLLTHHETEVCCCCDTRRAVIGMNLIILLLSIPFFFIDLTDLEATSDDLGAAREYSVPQHSHYSSFSLETVDLCVSNFWCLQVLCSIVGPLCLFNVLRDGYFDRSRCYLHRVARRWSFHPCILLNCCHLPCNHLSPRPPELANL